LEYIANVRAGSARRTRESAGRYARTFEG